jgi:outer membrane protein assembly factor BamB
MKMILALVLIATAGLGGRDVCAADWPNFRGPDHNGISTETGWLAKWRDEGPKVLWKASLGVGYAPISVAKGRAYASGNSDTNATLYCFDAGTGSILWKFTYPSQLYSVSNGPKGLGGTSGSPTIEGERVYFLSGDGCLYALQSQNGGVVWSNNLFANLGVTKPTWGFASSALVQNDLLILDIGGAGTAVEKATGKVAWTSDKGAPGYSTPVPWSFQGMPAVAILSSETAYGVEAKTGKQLWSFPFKATFPINIPDVVVSGNDFFLSSGLHAAVRVRFDGTQVTQVWTNQSFENHIASSVLIDGYLYGAAGSVTGSATLQCLDFATGAQKWSFPGLGVGGFIVADHKLIVLSELGELLVGEVSPDGFAPISRAQILPATCWTPPTLANGQIYCRNNKGDLVCLDVTAR